MVHPVQNKHRIYISMVPHLYWHGAPSPKQTDKRTKLDMVPHLYWHGAPSPKQTDKARHGAAFVLAW